MLRSRSLMRNIKLPPTRPEEYFLCESPSREAVAAAHSDISAPSGPKSIIPQSGRKGVATYKNPVMAHKNTSMHNSSEILFV
jgi:hypothetical protein